MSSRPGEITIPELSPRTPSGPFQFMIVDAAGTAGRITLQQIVDFFAASDNTVTALFAAIVKVQMTKAELRNYGGPLFRMVYLSDVSGPAFAVYQADGTAADNADNAAADPRIIVDFAGRRYRLLQATALWDLMLASFSPENL